MPGADRLGQRVGEVDAGGRLVDQLAQQRLAESRGRRVDRRQRVGQRLAPAQHPVARMDHLVAEEARPHLAEQPHARAGGERFRLALVEVEEAREERAARVAHLDHELPARPEGDVARDHLALDERRRAVPGRVDRRKHCLVLVAQRQVEDEVEVGPDPEFRELRLQRGLRRRACLAGGAIARGAQCAHPSRPQPSTRIASASTSAPRGSAATPTAARLGNGCGKYCAMISFTLAKCARSTR